jgi:Fe2+ transport system protein B
VVAAVNMVDIVNKNGDKIKTDELSRQLGCREVNISALKGKGITEEEEKELDDDAERIITNERYIYIAEVIKSCYNKKNSGGLTTSDKIDKKLTNLRQISLRRLKYDILYHDECRKYFDLLIADSNCIVCRAYAYKG